MILKILFDILYMYTQAYLVPVSLVWGLDTIVLQKKLPEREKARGVAVKGQPPQLSEFLTGTQENYSMHSMQTLASVPEEGSPSGSSITGELR